MPILSWPHRTSRELAATGVREYLERAGHSGRVKWSGDSFSVSVGFGTMLCMQGMITDSVIEITECSGALSGMIMERCRAILQEQFPNG